MPWHIEKRDEKYCVIKDADSSVEKCHPARSEAEAHMRALYASEDRMNSDYLVDEFLSVIPGEPFRLFPFGKLVKNGKARQITRELAAKFRLPHFKPPIKLGGHSDNTPAGGHLVGLEVRDDGLYALPEYTDQGRKALENGDYRYQSPEVIWDDGGLEDPATGNLITGPLIVGAALLHTPHLGEAAALYSVEPRTTEVFKMEDYVQIDKGFWAKIQDRLFPQEPVPEPEPKPEPEADDFTAVQQERDDYKAKLEALKAEQATRARVEHFVAGIAETKLDGDVEAAEMLAGMSDEQAEWVLTKLKALSAQVDDSELLGEKGKTGEVAAPDNPGEALNAAVLARMEEKKIDYVAALKEVQGEQPELVAAAYPNRKQESA